MHFYYFRRINVILQLQIAYLHELKQFWCFWSLEAINCILKIGLQISWYVVLRYSARVTNRYFPRLSVSHSSIDLLCLLLEGLYFLLYILFFSETVFEVFLINSLADMYTRYPSPLSFGERSQLALKYKSRNQALLNN